MFIKFLNWLFWWGTPEPAPYVEKYIIQLHRVMAVDGNSVRILSSWEPFEVRGREQAMIQARLLRSSNAWGGAVEFPYVTITDEDGVRCEAG